MSRSSSASEQRRVDVELTAAAPGVRRRRLSAPTATAVEMRPKPRWNGWPIDSAKVATASTTTGTSIARGASWPSLAGPKNAMSQSRDGIDGRHERRGEGDVEDDLSRPIRQARHSPCAPCSSAASTLSLVKKPTVGTNPASAAKPIVMLHERHGHRLAKPAHRRQRARADGVHQAAAAEEQQRLERTVRQQVIGAGLAVARRQRREHEGELADGRPGKRALEVGLRQREQRAEQHRDRGDDRQQRS